jgi:hypothetical protein
MACSCAASIPHARRPGCRNAARRTVRGASRITGRERHPIGEPQPLDLEVALGDRELGRQRDPLLAGVVQRIAQQIREPGDHRHRVALPRGPHERADRVQGVEQEVRLDLQLERVEPGLGQRQLEPCRDALPLAIFFVVLRRVVRGEHAAVEA